MSTMELDARQLNDVLTDPHEAGKESGPASHSV